MTVTIQSGSGAQPLDADLTTIAGLTATTDNFIQAVASAWASRTPAQALATLGAVGKFPFPATQVASAGANDLDDYEEGTWTPAMTFGGSATNVAYTNQIGNYIKIGRLVFINGRVTLTNNGTGVGGALITGLPFTAFNGISGTISFDYWIGTSAIVGNLQGEVQGNSTTFALGFGGATASVLASDTNITNSADMIFGGCYIASG